MFRIFTALSTIWAAHMEAIQAMKDEPREHAEFMRELRDLFERHEKACKEIKDILRRRKNEPDA